MKRVAPNRFASETGPSKAGATRVGGPISAAERNKRDSKNFVRWGRTFEEDYKLGRLTFDEYGLLALLWSRANPHNGSAIVSYIALAEESRGHFNKNKINKLFLDLKKKHYLWFDRTPGRRGPAQVMLNFYPLAGGGFNDFSRTFETGAKVYSTDDIIARAESQAAESPKVAEVDTEVDPTAQRFLEDSRRAFSVVFDTLGEDTSRGLYNESKKKDKWKNDKSSPLKGKPKYDPTRPNPSSHEEQRAREIADELGEEDYRFVTAMLKQHGIDVLERAYRVTLEQHSKGGVASKGALFNKLVRTFGEKDGDSNAATAP